MSGDFVIIPSNERDDYASVDSDSLQLSRKREVKGRLFKKHILNKGPLIHPASGRTVQIDDQFVQKMIKNFNEGVCPIVQVTLADDQNRHSEDPDKNLGEVVDLSVEGDKVYAIIDVRDEDRAPKMGKTLLGASAMLHLNYKNTKTGEHVGPTLLHSCVTNRPYVIDLDDYEEIVAASADSSNEEVVILTAPEDSPEKEETQAQEEEKITKESVVQEVMELVLDKIKGNRDFITALEEKMADELEITDATEVETQQEENTEEKEMSKPTVDELLAQLKEHGIDVAALQETAATVDTVKAELEEATALSNTLSEDLEKTRAEAQALNEKMAAKLADSGVVRLSNTDNPTSDDLIGAVATITQEHLSLSNQVAELREKDARNEVKELIREGKVAPAQEDVMVEMKLSNPSMYSKFVDTAPVVVEMEKETGTEPIRDEGHQLNIQDEIARLTAPSGAFGKLSNKK